MARRQTAAKQRKQGESFKAIRNISIVLAILGALSFFLSKNGKRAPRAGRNNFMPCGA